MCVSRLVDSLLNSPLNQSPKVSEKVSARDKNEEPDSSGEANIASCATLTSGPDVNPSVAVPIMNNSTRADVEKKDPILRNLVLVRRDEVDV